MVHSWNIKLPCLIDNRKKLQMDDPTNYETITGDDAAWILTNSFLILTMQSGFTLLEAGCVSSKNVANIVMKNAVDIVVGGLSYWMFGYGLSFGRSSTPYFGTSDFFVNENVFKNGSGTLYSRYMFQFAFAATSTSIVSGAIAERVKFSSYIVFSFLNTFIYSFPANWIWNKRGFLKSIGFLDFAGGCVVHFSGGVVSLIGSRYLGPRIDRFTQPETFGMSSPVTSLTGMLLLWWSWLGFNCGSTFGVHGLKWKFAGLIAINTMNSSIGGGIAGLALSFLFRKKLYSIRWFINSVLGALVTSSSISAYISPIQSLLVGMVGGTIAVAGESLVDKLQIDDPVVVIPVHLFSGMWGIIAIGLFGHCNGLPEDGALTGLFCSGSPKLLGVQLLGLLCTFVWCSIIALGLFWVIDKLIGLRMSNNDERLGADMTEHGIVHSDFSGKLANAVREFHEGNIDKDTMLKVIQDDVETRGRTSRSGVGPIVETRRAQVLGQQGLLAYLEGSKKFNNILATTAFHASNHTRASTCTKAGFEKVKSNEISPMQSKSADQILSVTNSELLHVPKHANPTENQ